MNKYQASGSKLVYEIEASKEVIDMLELWLNKANETREVKKYILIVETSGGIGHQEDFGKEFEC